MQSLVETIRARDGAAPVAVGLVLGSGLGHLTAAVDGVVHLADDVSVYPRLKLPFGISVPAGTEVAGPADVLRHL